MQLWNHFFGKKVVIEGEDESGKLVRNVIDKNILDEAIKNGKAVYGGKIKVHVLDPNHGYYITEWEVGEDVEPADVAQFGTPSRELYVLVAYENGKPNEVIARKDVWDKLHSFFDRTENGEDCETERQRYLDELKSKIQKED